jgi:hypothetical protein
MRVLSATINLLIISAIFIVTACNDAGKSEKKKLIDTPAAVVTSTPATNDTPPPPPTELPPGVKLKPANLCFENEGLKYNLRIRIEYITPERANVEVISTDIGSNKESVASFSCDIKDNQLLVKSVSSLPAAGDASEWIANKNWVIDANKAKQTLLIPFKAKNYETNKWEEMTYSFDPCQ